MPSNSTDKQYEFFATCAKGAEKVLAGELAAIAKAAKKSLQVRPLSSGVAFFGGLEDAYHACLQLFTASRVLLIIARVEADDAEVLYRQVRALPWEQHIAAHGTLAVAARGVNDQLRNTNFTALRVKDAICDRLTELFGQRPTVQQTHPDVQLNVSLRENRATIAIDLSGEPLHRRGYRSPNKAIQAPLRETLAATMLLAAGWSKSCRAFGDAYVLDPLCGSGTIAIEAALMLAHRAPGLQRQYWGFSGWLGHDAKLWQAVLNQAKAQAAAYAEQAKTFDKATQLRPQIYASDIDPAAIAVAQDSAQKAGVAQFIHFEVADVAKVKLTTQQLGNRGLLACNPPYGERISSASQLPALYAALAQLKSSNPTGFDTVVITPDDQISVYLGGPPTQQIQTYNGPIETAIRIWNVDKGTHDQNKACHPERRSFSSGVEGSPHLQERRSFDSGFASAQDDTGGYSYASAKNDKLPLTLITGARMQPYWASSYFNNPRFRESHPYPTAQMSEATLQQLGIAGGQWVTVQTATGAAKFMAEKAELVDGVVSCEYGWWYPEQQAGEPNLSGIWQSNVNLLTNANIENCEPLIGSWNYNNIPCTVSCSSDPQSFSKSFAD
jgi:23S rRNA G2445 N2-methylase RlmL